MVGSPRLTLWKGSPTVCPVEGMPSMSPLDVVRSRRSIESPGGGVWRGLLEVYLGAAPLVVLCRQFAVWDPGGVP
jgi:hypothetical protein